MCNIFSLMDKLPHLLDEVVTELDKYDEIREYVISATRKLNRSSGRGIASLVMGEPSEEKLTLSRQTYTDLIESLEKITPIISWKVVNSGVEEYAEFEILHSIIVKNHIPTPKELNIPVWVWLSGLGDVPGELRRIILNKLLKGELQRAKELLEVMQHIFIEISGLSFSKTLIPNFRRKLDVARSVTERTESDVLNYLISSKNREEVE